MLARRIAHYTLPRRHLPRHRRGQQCPRTGGELRGQSDRPTATTTASSALRRRRLGRRCGMTLAALPEWEILTRVYPDLQHRRPRSPDRPTCRSPLPRSRIVPPTAEPPLADVSVQIEPRRGCWPTALPDPAGNGIVDLGRPGRKHDQAQACKWATRSVSSPIGDGVSEFSPDPARHA
ncbi:MAG: hypothetical protein R2856_03995 [Caldilineaceae bacterium]